MRFFGGGGRAGFALEVILTEMLSCTYVVHIMCPKGGKCSTPDL